MPNQAQILSEDNGLTNCEQWWGERTRPSCQANADIVYGRRTAPLYPPLYQFTYNPNSVISSVLY
jgi:hypothetical protein